MAHPNLQLEQIIDLAEELRLAGFDLGTQQYVAAQDLLLALAAHQQLPNDPHRLRTLLAPIFCSSPGEQEEFYQRFAAWLKRHPELKQDADAPTANSVIEGATTSQAAKRRAHWLHRLVSVAAICLLVLLTMGAGYLALPVSYTLTGQVVSSEDGRSVADAQVEFFNGHEQTDAAGNFSLHYRARNFRRFFQKSADLTISHNEHEPHRSQLRVYQPAPQNITLQKRQVAPETPQEEVPSNPEPAPTPVPVLLNNSTTPSESSNRSSSTIVRRALLAAAPLLLFAVWWLWRWWRRRALLQKLQAAGDPQLNRIRVTGAADLLFHSQAFRRAVQELRRHRQVAVKDLDIAATVRATIGQGGMFTPRYGSRKASPEYLLLIDRANLNDEQARFGEEVARRLEAGGVFVDRYYFQNDPRTCRLREPHSPLLTLPELAARHPEHQLLIFSDGAGFISPITGEPEHWLPLLDHWPRRVLLTPELAATDDDRELALAEQDFLILPATAEGLAVLTEALAAGIASKPSSNGRARPFPRLILERPKRWLERNTPRPSVVNELHGQLRQYLGDDGWHWLAACAVYPTVSWDITLYLGYKLLGRTEEFERLLLSLVRLPWFRYGTMPDWLRLRLIESLTPAQERAVRHALEELLLSALDRPRAGVELEFAAPAPPEKSTGWRYWWQAFQLRYDKWRRRRRLSDLIKNEPPESPLRDYVFLGFFSSGGANRLTINLPEILRRALFPQGKAVLGLRTTTALLTAIALAAPGVYLLYGTLRQPPAPPLVTNKLYQQMSREEQLRFVSAKVSEVVALLGSVEGGSIPTTDPMNAIQDAVGFYAHRVGNGSTKTITVSGALRPTFNEDLSYVFARGIKYAPIISQAQTDRISLTTLTDFDRLAVQALRALQQRSADSSLLLVTTVGKLAALGKPQEALEIARKIENANTRALALISIADGLTEAGKTEAAEQVAYNALITAKQVTDEDSRSLVEAKGAEVLAKANGPKYTRTSTRKVSASDSRSILGLYLAMAESEFSSCLKNNLGGEGIFQMEAEFATRNGIDPKSRCDIAASSSALSKFLADRVGEYGSDGLAATLVLASFRRDDDVRSLVTKYPKEQKSYWMLVSHSNELPLLAQKEIFELVPRFIAAAIVGENPQRFGLQMEPLSTYAKVAEPTLTPTPTSSPKPATSPKPVVASRPRVTPTPVVVAATSCDNTVAKGQRIRSVELQNGKGATEDIGNEYPLGPLFVGKLYQAGDDRRIKSEAQGLLAARKIDPSAVRVCVHIIPCRAIEGCVEIYLQVAAPRPNQSPVQRTPTTAMPQSANPSAAQNQEQANAPAQQQQQQMPMSNSNATNPASISRILARNARDGMTARAEGAEVILRDTQDGEDLATLKGHSGTVTSAAFSPDGNTLATGGTDKTVKLWDVRGGREIRSLQGPTATVTGVYFGPDGKRLAVGSLDKTVTVWDVASGKQLARLDAAGSVYVVAFSPDGRLLVSGGQEGVLKVWDAARFQLQREIAAGAAIDNLAFRGGTSIRLLGRSNKNLGTWDLTTGALIPEKGR